MKKKFVGLLVLVLLCGMQLNAQGVDMQAAIPADPAVRIGKLDNGLTYYIRHNAKPEKQAEFFILHDVGAIQEEDAQIGLAHFLEHMAFNGTKNFPDKNLISYLEKIGVKFGANLNAGTGQDMTVYNISSVPLLREGIIDTALLMLHDWSYYITLDPKEIDKERGVIVEEFRTGNNAARRVQEKTAPTIYNNSRYAKRNVIGNLEALKSFSHQELVGFYHKWYRTDLQAIVVVGDIDVDAVEAKIKKIMADIPAVENPAPKVPVLIADNVEPLVSVVSDPELTTTSATLYIKRQPLPAVMNDKVIAEKLSIMLSLVTDMANYRLHEISQKPNAPFVQAGTAQGAMTSTMEVIMAQAIAREGEADKAFEALYAEIEKIRRFGFTEAELERIKSDFMRIQEQAYDNRNDRRSSEYVDRYLENFRKNAMMPSPEVEWQLDSTLIATTNLMEINALAKQLMTQTNQVVVVSGPEKAGVPMPTEDALLAVIEKVRAAELEAYVDNSVKEPLISKDLKGSKVKKTATDRFGATVWTLANGVKVVVKPTTFKADEVLMKASMPGGLSLLADEDVASGELLSTLVSMSGVSKFTMLDLAKQLAGKMASVTPTINNYENSLNATASPKDMETMLQLVYLYLTEPRFDLNDFDVMVGQYKAALANVSTNPDYIMQDSLTNAIYGANPRRQVMSVKLLENAKFDAMERIYKMLYGNADDATFVFAGNINLDAFKPLVEKYLGSLPVNNAKAAWKDDMVTYVNGKRETRFEVPMQTPKTSVFYMFQGELPYTVENLMSVSVLQQILSIRYTESIREEKGGTYGVQVAGNMALNPKNKYMVQLQFDTDPDMADELMEIIVEEIETMAKEGPKAEDLSKIREFLVKQRPDDLTRNATWLRYMDSFYLNNVDLNTTYDEVLAGLSGEKIKAMAAKIVADGNACCVVMQPQK